MFFFILWFKAYKRYDFSYRRLFICLCECLLHPQNANDTYSITRMRMIWLNISIFFLFMIRFFCSLKKINKEFIFLKNKQYIARHLKIQSRRYNNMVSMAMSLQRARDACVNEHSTFYEICIPINIDWRNIDDDTVNAYIYTILLPNESAMLQSIHPDKICFNQWQMRSCFFSPFFKHFQFIYAFWMF